MCDIPINLGRARGRAKTFKIKISYDMKVLKEDSKRICAPAP